MRKGGRTPLMLSQILVAFLLFGLLQGMKSGVDHAINNLEANLYFVSSAEMGKRLPASLGTRIGSVPGAKSAYAANLFGATYQTPSQHIIGVAATSVATGWITDFGMVVSKQALNAMTRLRTAALLSEELADKYGWKVGDRIPLQSNVMKQDGSSTTI